MQIKIINRSPNELPVRETASAAGMDLRAWVEGEVSMGPLERQLIPTGLYLELPHSFEAQIRPRSGLAYKHGITVLNSPGTIDADFRGEIRVLLVNLSNEKYIVRNGDRIAQMIIAQHALVNWEETDLLTVTERGEGGYGHTGI